MPRTQSKRKVWLIAATAVSAGLVALPWFTSFGPVNGQKSGIFAAVLVSLVPGYLLARASFNANLHGRLRQAIGMMAVSLLLVSAGNFVRLLAALGVSVPNVPGIDLSSNIVIWVIGFAGLIRIPLMPVNRGTLWRVCTDVGIAGVGMALIISVLWTLPGLHDGPAGLRNEVMVFDAMAVGNLFVLTLIMVRGPIPQLRKAILWLAAIIVIDTVYLVVFQYVVGTRSNDTRLLNSLFFAEYLAYLYAAVHFLDDTGAEEETLSPISVLWVVNPLPVCAVLGVGILLIASALTNSYSVVPLSAGIVAMAILLLVRMIFSNFEKLREVEQKAQRESHVQAEKLALTRRLSGGIAHIINNMMTVVHGHAELLRTELPSESLGSNSLEAITSSAYRVSALAWRLELASGMRNTQESQTRLVEAVLLQRDYVNRMVGQKREVIWDLSGTGGNALVAPSDMETIMRELISNAGEATFHGGKITIRVREEIQSPLPDGVSPHPEEGLYSVLEVADTGRGIPEGDLPHVTEPFFTSRPLLEGRGLGLSIVHGIVASYGGGLLIDTVPGAGSRIRVYLPAAEAV
ncbi:MAG TPA: ATP-binding protein [Opitutaceae bacterium]